MEKFAWYTFFNPDVLDYTKPIVCDNPAGKELLMANVLMVKETVTIRGFSWFNLETGRFSSTGTAWDKAVDAVANRAKKYKVYNAIISVQPN